MKTALITGVNGQIGSFLSEILLEKDYEVYGTIRSDTENTKVNSKISILRLDLKNLDELEKIILKINPSEIYNLAALSNARVSIEKPEETMKLNLLPVIRICEIIKNKLPQTKIFQAGSAEFYGNLSGTIDEKTPFQPMNPYAIAKLGAFNFMRYSREIHKLFCCNGIIFNSESSRRQESFVTKKISLNVASLINGNISKFSIGNLESRRDWIHAYDTANAIYQMMQQKNSDDYIISLGEDHSIRDFIELAFKLSGEKIFWRGKGINEIGLNSKEETILKINPNFFRLDDRRIRGNNSKLKSIGWKPKYSFEDIIKEMVEYDLKINLL